MQQADWGPASANTTAVFCSFSFTEPQNNEGTFLLDEASEMVLLNTDRSVLQDWKHQDVPPCSTLLKLSVEKQDKSNPDDSFSKSCVFAFLYHEQSQRKTDFHKNTMAQPCILACDWLLIKCSLRAHGTWITFEPYTHKHTQAHNVYSTKLVSHGDQHAWSFTSSSSSSYTIWSPFVTAVTVCEPACVFLFSCSREHVWACVCLFVSWNLAVLGDHVAWESGGESRTPKHLQLQLNSVALLLIKPNNTCGLRWRIWSMIKIDERN